MIGLNYKHMTIDELVGIIQQCQLELSYLDIYTNCKVIKHAKNIRYLTIPPTGKAKKILKTIAKVKKSYGSNK
jgi:hypothetical protein